MQVHVRHLFISPGHNFFGRHGQPPGPHPTVAVERVQCREGLGIEGDRFFGYKEDYRGQITFFDFAVFEDIKRSLALPGLSPGAFRRNAVVDGLDLPSLIGVRFTLGAVEFEGCGESAPCHWMNQAVGPGAEAWLKGKGGLRAKIRRDGSLVCGPVPFAIVSGQLALEPPTH